MTTDRSAAELLAEYDADCSAMACDMPCDTSRRRLLVRLASAEQALATAKTEASQLELVVADQAEIIAVLRAPPPVCSCGRCDGRGRLRIHTDGAEEWVPCRSPGQSSYLPDLDRWKS